jgi:hypothetical protein
MKKRWYLFIPLVVVAMAGFGYVTMLLWNALLPAIFHLPVIDFWQAVGLLVLSRLLLGGMGGHHARHAHHWRRNFRERWETLTPEERERFHHHHAHFCRNTREPETPNKEQ